MLRSRLVANGLRSRSTYSRALRSRHLATQTPKLFDTILVANRGEIACRVIRTAREMGVKSVAVFSEVDRNAPHVEMADEAYLIGPAPANQSYLLGDRIIDVARRSGAQGIHPGYGFLSENAKFAKQCAESGVSFIGPPVGAIEAMGSKSASKNIMEKANVPVVPGYHGDDQDIETLRREADKIGFPVLIKAVLGGGGKGMRIVESAEDFDEALEGAKREALNSFSDDRVLIEKYLTKPRHIEFQVFADQHGNALHVLERDCSLQRRHQKVIEESPAPGLSEELRQKMGTAAVNAAKAVGYVGAGTVEFIVDADNMENFYFMEMNTRLQVEHPVTEMVSGIDLVEWQLRVASGFELPITTQGEIGVNGHAFEARVYAENPHNNFLPDTGKIYHLREPETSSVVRIDTGIRENDEVSIFYDPMISKLIVWGEDRDIALRRLIQSLQNYNILGLHTNLSFLERCASHPAFVSGNVDTGFIERYESELLPEQSNTVPDTALAHAALAYLLSERDDFEWELEEPDSPWVQESLQGARFNEGGDRKLKFVCGESETEVEVGVQFHVQSDASPDAPVTLTLLLPGGSQRAIARITEEGDLVAELNGVRRVVGFAIKDDTISVLNDGEDFELTVARPKFDGGEQVGSGLLSPMPGSIMKVLVKEGQKVEKDDPLVVMVAMKMEHTIRAPSNGTVTSVFYGEGDQVEAKKELVAFEPEE